MKVWKKYVKNLYTKEPEISPNSLPLNRMVFGSDKKLNSVFRSLLLLLSTRKKWGALNINPPLHLKSTTSFLLALFIVLLPTKISIGCGPTAINFKGYTFLNNGLVNKKSNFGPFFLNFDNIFEKYDAKAIQTDANLAEWHGRFCEIPSLEDMKKLIYKSSIKEMQLLRTSAKNKKGNLDFRLANNTFARHLKSNQCLETIDYLIFAKECEPHVLPSKDAWETPKRDAAMMQKLIRDGKRAFKDIKSHYIRLRYAYQLLRLAHYMHDYQQVLDLHDYLMPKIDPINSIINYWIMGHQAGALRQLGRHVEASYLYSLIFENAPSKRASAFRSFKIKTDEEWKQCLLLCKDDHERATLYAIRANEDVANTVSEMEQIYLLEPKNENLELLLIKGIKKWERYLLGKDFNDFQRHNRRYLTVPSKEVGKKIIQLQQFARKCRQEKKVERPELWHIAEGYLEFLAGDLYAANKTFKAAEDKLSDPLLKEQVQAMHLALNIANWDHIDEDIEEEAAEIRRNHDIYDKYKDFPDFMYDKLAVLYQEANSPGKAFRCHYKIEALKPNPKEAIVNDLLALATKEDPTPLEKYFLQNKKGGNIKKDLIDLKGTLYMSDFQMEAALETFKMMDRAEWNNYGRFNPFYERLKDCQSCALPDTAHYYNKGEIIEKILDWEYRAKSELDNAAAYYYRIGNAFYNMSYFGYAWNAMDYFYSGSSWNTWNLGKDDHVMEHWAFPYGNKENMDMSRALFYYEKSRLLAKRPELAARATFMAAKCEQKMYYMSSAYKKPCRNCIPNPPIDYLKYFGVLNTLYSETDFYRQMINECKYFRAYVAR